MKRGWYIVNRNSGDLVLRGPYRHAETAAAVRDEMELAEPDNCCWNLAIVFCESDTPTP